MMFVYEPPASVDAATYVLRSEADAEHEATADRVVERSLALIQIAGTHAFCSAALVDQWRWLGACVDEWHNNDDTEWRTDAAALLVLLHVRRFRPALPAFESSIDQGDAS
jgi:hypothetical protein